MTTQTLDQKWDEATKLAESHKFQEAADSFLELARTCYDLGQLEKMHLAAERSLACQFLAWGLGMGPEDLP